MGGGVPRKTKTGGRRKPYDVDGTDEELTVDELIEIVRAACADILHVLPGMSMDRLEDMTWRELSKWRGTATDLFKRVNGITE